MIKSMTGFARADISSKIGKLSLEISTINKRFLEISIFLPKVFAIFETDIRSFVSKKITRGQVSLKFDFNPSEKNIFSILPDIAYLKSLKKGWGKLAKDLGYKKDEISLNFLLQQTKYIPEEKIKDVLSFKKLIFQALEQAVANVSKMRQKEGSLLVKDLKIRVQKIQKELLFIRQKTPVTKKNFEKKLKAKFEDIFKEKKEIEDRVLKELAVFADKIDIAEEVLRLDLHLKSFLNLLKVPKDAIGRKLEFLLQECLRETNTIASKASDAHISKAAVEIKDEIEKIKEQLQNIE
ncbi:MAG: hypothetical protein KR126chlam6_00792 [Candidatus Anoxychlamydiales bacterium]|nr:hypothetical protein [Candidatus Anoxychlamydiales bacterium]